METIIKYWIWFSSLFKIPPAKKILLIEHFKDPALLWEASDQDLRALGFITQQMINEIEDREKRRKTDKLFENVKKCDADVITYNDSVYPCELKYMADPPAVLYCRGKLQLSDVHIAVVGSRRATEYGMSTARKLSRELASNGVTVVSGMARGIDSGAHKGALEAGGRTVAVLGCGIDTVYPSENAELMKNIIKSGAVLSEYPPGTPPLAFNFPARNRIISGLSRAVTIIEANAKSGSLITADFALDQGKDVFAVPGNINSPNSVGTNMLIKDGAKLITGAEDILNELNMSYCANNMLSKEKRKMDQILGSEEKSIAQRLQLGPAHIDTIARDCKLSVQLAGSVLVMLELSGFVEQLPGKYYKLAD